MKIVSTFILVLFMSCNELNVAPPEPVYPIPSQRQMDWQEMEFYAFIHFNMNTFTNMEWGTGGERPKQFNPTELDCRQWVKSFKIKNENHIYILQLIYRGATKDRQPVNHFT